MSSWLRRWLLTSTLIVSMLAAAHAQDRPRFRSGVEVTSVDVTVVDSSGRPVPDLEPADFTVLVDGVARRVVSAEWVPRSTTATPRPSAPDGSMRLAGGDRLVLFVVDQPNIRFGGVAGHRDALNRFIDRLRPSDPVGIINLGVGARSQPFTTDRALVKQTLSSSVGGVPHPPSADKNLTFEFLRALMDDLQAIDAPKTVVLISQGLQFSEQARQSFADVGRAAAAARTTIYALRLDERISDINQKEPAARLSPDPSPNGNAGGLGEPGSLPAGPIGDRGPTGLEPAGDLYAIAAATGGAMFTVVMNADLALARIESELSGSYLLAIESAPGDGDGKPHSLSVSVGRPNVTVRAGRYLPL